MDPFITPPQRDERISEIFYFFEALTTLATGRTVGRKIGVVQEVMLRKYFEAEEPLRRRLYLEQLLEGRSGASHKVEFSWHPLTSHEEIGPGSRLPELDDVTVVAVDAASERVRLSGPWEGGDVWVGPERPIPRSGAARSYFAERGLDARVFSVTDQGTTIDIVDRSRLLASLESKRVGAQRFSSSEKLGSGIQTIEKAKQASLVAIDLDLQHNGSVKPLQNQSDVKQLISLVALGNGVHWTSKDLAVLGTYVDFTFLVKDTGLLRYLEYVRERAPDDDFLDFFLGYFKGMTRQDSDDFEVSDADFEVILPGDEARTVRSILLDHIERAER